MLDAAWSESNALDLAMGIFASATKCCTPSVPEKVEFWRGEFVPRKLDSCAKKQERHLGWAHDLSPPTFPPLEPYPLPHGSLLFSVSLTPLSRVRTDPKSPSILFVSESEALPISPLRSPSLLRLAPLSRTSLPIPCRSPSFLLLPPLLLLCVYQATATRMQGRSVASGADAARIDGEGEGVCCCVVGEGGSDGEMGVGGGGGDERPRCQRWGLLSCAVDLMQFSMHEPANNATFRFF